MKIKPMAAKLCFIITAALTLIGVILRTVAMFTAFDTSVGYFNDAFLPHLLTALSFAAALLPIVFTVIIPKNALPQAWHEPRRNIAAIPPLVCFLLSGIWMLWQTAFDGFSNILLLVAGIFSLIAAVYYLLLVRQSLGGRMNVNTLSAIGLASVFWGLLSMAETYTDQFTTMNSPIKLGLQFGFLGVMLVTVSELRFRLDKPAPRAALCFHCIAAYFCLTGSIPTLIALSVGILNTAIHTAYALGLLGVGVYATARLIIYFFITPTEPANDENVPAFEVEPENNHQ